MGREREREKEDQAVYSVCREAKGMMERVREEEEERTRLTRGRRLKVG
jgi:hypothetical protein